MNPERLTSDKGSRILSLLNGHVVISARQKSTSDNKGTGIQKVSQKMNSKSEFQTNFFAKNSIAYPDQVDFAKFQHNNSIFIYDNNVLHLMTRLYSTCLHKAEPLEVFV